MLTYSSLQAIPTPTLSKNEGYFINSTVKPLTTNYVIVILPASNPGNIQSLSDLAKPGKKIAMAAYNVPIGTVSYTALANLAKVNLWPGLEQIRFQKCRDL